MLELIKVTARLLAKPDLNLPLTYSTFIEISVRLLIGAPSYSYALCDPDKYTKQRKAFSS